MVQSKHILIQCKKMINQNNSAWLIKCWIIEQYFVLCADVCIFIKHCKQNNSWMNRKLLPSIFTLVQLLLLLNTFAQKDKQKKYSSVFWEITGNGLSRPSYLFGTMHVSSKMAFHLSDSFYLGIKNADVVALETNPGSWQEDLSVWVTPCMNWWLTKHWWRR